MEEISKYKSMYLKIGEDMNLGISISYAKQKTYKS